MPGIYSPAVYASVTDITMRPLPSRCMLDVSGVAFPNPFPPTFRAYNYEHANKATFRGYNPSVVRLRSSSFPSAKKIYWILRREGAVGRGLRPSFNGKIHSLFHWKKQWKGQGTLCPNQNRYFDSQVRSVPSKHVRRLSMQKYNEGNVLQILVWKVYKILHLERIVIPLLHLLRILDFVGETHSIPFRKARSPFITGSHCSKKRTTTILPVARVLGRVLLFALFFVHFSVQPFPRLSASAHAAPSVDGGTIPQPSKDLYETLFERFKLKDAELGREQGRIGRIIQAKLQEFQNRMKDLRKRFQSSRQNYEELYGSNKERVGKGGKKNAPFPYEERVSAVLEKHLQAHRQRTQDNVKTEDDVSSYEQELRHSFEERFMSLEAFAKESIGKLNKEVALLQEARKLTEFMRKESRRLQGKALRDMDNTVSELKQEETHLVDMLRKVIRKYLIVQTKFGSQDGINEDMDRELQVVDAEVAEAWERLLHVEANILQKKEKGFQVALEILPRLEQQCEEAISTFMSNQSLSSLSKELQEKLTVEKVTNEFKKSLEEVEEHEFLPQAVDTQQAEPPINQQTLKILERVKLIDEPSKMLLDRIDNMIKEDIQAEEMMAEDGVVAPSLKKWKEEKAAELRQIFLKNPEAGRQYVTQKQEQILLYRDHVLADTWYEERRRQWVMSPESVDYAVEKKLVENARIRHDRGIMYLRLKGDGRVFYVDLQAYDNKFENSGGLNALHLRLLSSGVPTSVEVMWIPFSQWESLRVILLPFKLCSAALRSVWQSGAVTPIVIMYFQSLGTAVEELLARICFPLLERLPKWAQIAIGLQQAGNAAAHDRAPFLMELKKYIQKNMEARYGEGEGSTAWWISLPFRCFIVGIPLLYFSRLLGKVLGQLFGPGEDMNEVEWKEKKGKELMKKLNAENSKDLTDPVRQAFDRMRRIKDPEITLKDFSGLDMVKKEVHEIVTFLRDPSVFKEMGARPPRGVLILGEPGTGKTSLALAIAAEAKVPFVELDGLELEGGSWVGQGASNVRDLFKTAREVAPMIIFMDDFDYFAGVRGESGDTRQQDHESLINQLLVELDGFETQDGVVLLATSSRPENIDEALRRPGRMDRTILLPMPNKRERELILKTAAERIMDHDLIELVDWKEMARKTEGMTPQQLILVPRGLETSFVAWKHTDAEELFNIFWLLASLNKITPDWVANTKLMKNFKYGLRDWLGLRVTKEEIDAAVECIDLFSESRPGLELRSPGYPWTREFKFPHAVWAAGRGLLGVLLPNFDVVQQIWLDQSSWEGIGFTRFTKRMEGGYEETRTFTRTYYEKKLVLCFGSSVAAYLLLPYGESNDLSKHEIEEAREIATAMVLEFGWGPDDSQAIYASGDENITMSMGEGVESELNAKAAKLFNTAADRAACVLQKNKQALEALVEHLLQFDSISHQDITRILKENGAVLEEDPFMLFHFNNDGAMQVSTNGTGRSTRLLSATGKY